MQVSELEGNEKRYRMAARDLEAAEALARLAQRSALRRDESGSSELLRRLGAEAVVTSTVLSQDTKNLPYHILFCKKMSSLFSLLYIIWNMDMPCACRNLESSFCKYQDQSVVPQLFCDLNQQDKIAKNIPRQLYSTSYQSKTASKSRQKLTQSEREERKLRRVLANRESARQTIRRRQAISQELARKAAAVLEENEKLKKAKELKLEEKNSLKDANGFLKAQLAKIKKTEPGEKQECPETLLAAKAVNNQPSLMPCYWPSLFQSHDAYQLHRASSSHVMGSPHFPFPPTFTNQGQDNLGIIKPGTPIFVLPVPCLFPFFTHSSGIHSQDSHPCGKRSFPDTQPREENNHSLSNNHPREEASSSFKKPLPISGGSMRQGSLRKNQEQQPKNSEDMLAATEARRRRKELVKFKNISFCHSPRE